MRIKMNKSYRTIFFRYCPEFCKCNCVVTTENDRTGIFLKDSCHTFFNCIVAWMDVTRSNVEITNISALKAFHDINLHDYVVRFHHCRNITDCVRTKS